MLVFVPFGAFSPGGSRFGEGLAEALNVVPLWDGYYPVQDRFTQSSAGVAVRVTGAYAHRFPVGGGGSTYSGDAVTIYAGNRTTQWVVDPAGAWTDISRAGGYAVVATDEPARWRYASFGNDIWAANGFDIFQRRTNNAGLFANGPASTFVPRPRFCAPVREFMVVADLSANGGSFASDQFTWSDINDATWYDAPDATRPASTSGGSTGKYVRSQPGQITGLTGGEYGVIYKRQSTYALQFTGGNDIFRLDELSAGVGVTLPGSLIKGRFADYFFGGDGFYRRAGLNPPEKFSPPAIDQLFVDPAHYNTLGYVHGAVSTMWQEDLLMVGFEDNRTGLLFWFFAHAALDAIPINNLPLTYGVCCNPDTGLWSILTGIDVKLTAGIGIPERALDLSTNQVIGVHWFADDLGSPSICRFSGENVGARLTSKRQAFSVSEGGVVNNVRVKRILPLFTVPASNSVETFSPNPTVPDVQVTLRMSNDLHMANQLDAAGTLISPREEIVSLADEFVNDWGWMPQEGQGRTGEIQVDIPAGAQWRSFLGCWLDVDVVAVP